MDAPRRTRSSFTHPVVHAVKQPTALLTGFARDVAQGSRGAAFGNPNFSAIPFQVLKRSSNADVNLLPANTGTLQSSRGRESVPLLRWLWARRPSRLPRGIPAGGGGDSRRVCAADTAALLAPLDARNRDAYAEVAMGRCCSSSRRRSWRPFSGRGNRCGRSTTSTSRARRDRPLPARVGMPSRVWALAVRARAARVR